MKRTSSPVSSSQSTLHRRLDSVIRRNLEATWKQPLHSPTVAAFRKLLTLGEFGSGDALILDSGCGTGASTKSIAARFPGSTVIGIDRSSARLGKLGRHEFPFRDGNIYWIQAELATFWRLALNEQWRLQRHYLLYPNPWPKPGHLQRRWHAHPVFSQMLELGGVLELRCNWSIYAEEFRYALEVARPDVTIETETADSEDNWDGVETPFGIKYARSGHPLHRIVSDLGAEGQAIQPG